MLVPTIWSLIFSMSLTFGFGIGVMYFSPLYFYLSLNKGKKGLITGSASFFFASAKIMWTPVARYMVNPENLDADSQGFFPDSVADRAPRFLRLVVYVTLGLNVLGLFLLYYPPWIFIWKKLNFRRSGSGERRGRIGSAVDEKQIRNSKSSSAHQKGCDDTTTFSATTKCRCNGGASSTTSGLTYRSKSVELAVTEMGWGGEVNLSEGNVLNENGLGETEKMQLSQNEPVHQKPEAMSSSVIIASVVFSLAYCCIHSSSKFLVGNYKPV